MAVPTYSVSCISKTLIAKDVYDIRFAKPESFTFKPGQFILFDVPHADNPADIQARAYSIASTPGEQELLFAIKLTPGGRMSRWVEERCQAESALLMKGPFGNFVLDANTGRDFLFICTSTGNAPFRSMLLSALQSGDTRRMDLIYGVRAREDLFWKEEFEALAEKYPNFFVHIALSGAPENWAGHRGRVQTLVPQIAPDISGKSIYVCGNPEMTKEVKQLCLNEWGVMKADLHVEGFI
ncbi:MAG: CDP-4-dehydro-6-deoxyglucose reductase [Candidatus Peribacteria bacterium]|nr:CDP-4-dehydro-6-deoxyglucose reductase [Candidatus Peribacteria bacterium]